MAFCCYCGRSLAPGEVCDCQNQNARGQSTPGAGYRQDTPPAVTYRDGGAQTGYTQSGAQTGYTQNGAQTGYTQNGAQAGYTQSSAQTGYTQGGYNQSGAQTGYNPEIPTGGTPFAKKLGSMIGNIGSEEMEDSTEKILGNAIGTNGLDVFERGKQIVPECIKANEGEVPVKQYRFAILRTRGAFEKAEGRLQITNKRLLFRATGRSLQGKTELHEEFNLSEIAGFEARNRHVFSLLKMLGAILLTAVFGALGALFAWLVVDSDSSNLLKPMEIFAIIWSLLSVAGVTVMAVMIRKKNYYNPLYILRHFILSPAVAAMVIYTIMGDSWYRDGIDSEVMIIFGIPLAIAFLINLFLMSFVPDLTVSIKTKGGLPSIFIAKESQSFFQMIFGGHAAMASGFREIGPWKDTDAAIREIGTIIDEINTLGDAAVAKWAEKPENN